MKAIISYVTFLARYSGQVSNHTISHSITLLCIHFFTPFLYCSINYITDSLRSRGVSTPSPLAPNCHFQVSWSAIPVGIKTADNIILTLCYLQSRLNILV